MLSINKLQHLSFKQRSREIRIFCKYALHSVHILCKNAPNRVQFCCFLYLFSILSNIETRNANMDTAPVSTQPLLWSAIKASVQTRVLRWHQPKTGLLCQRMSIPPGEWPELPKNCSPHRRFPVRNRKGLYSVLNRGHVSGQ